MKQSLRLHNDLSRKNHVENCRVCVSRHEAAHQRQEGNKTSYTSRLEEIIRNNDEPSIPHHQSQTINVLENGLLVVSPNPPNEAAKKKTAVKKFHGWRGFYIERVVYAEAEMVDEN